MRELLKARHIADELIGYFLRHGICDIKLQLKFCEIDTRVIVEGVCLEKVKDLDKAVRLMNLERRPEIEEEYENLLGSSIGDNALGLLGSMVDKATYRYEGNKLILEVVRYN